MIWQDEEFKRALSRISDLEELVRSSPQRVVELRDSQDADDGSTSEAEEVPPNEQESRKGKRRHEDIAEELECEALEPFDDEDEPIYDEEALFPSTRVQARLERLCASICRMGDKMRSGPGRSADDANISTQLSNFENRVENHFGRMSRDVRMIEDEMTRLRRSISSLHDDVLCLAQGHASGSRRGTMQ